MARLSAAALLLLLVSLLAVAHGDRTANADDESAEAEQTGPPISSAPRVVGVEGAGPFLRLPSAHRRHRPCGRHGAGLVDRHLWWAHDHGVSRHDPERGEEARPVHVAEPDPDRSFFPDSDGRHGSEEAAVKSWKEEMLRRMSQPHSQSHFHHHHHGLRHHIHRREEDEEDHEVHDHEGEEAQEVAGWPGMKRRVDEEDVEKEGEENKMEKIRLHLHHRLRHHHHEPEAEDDGEKEMRKEPHPHHADSESDDEQDDEVEEMVRRFRKAILRTRYGHQAHHHGRRFHHHHHHSHRHAEAEGAEKADGEVEEGGMVTWIKGIVNWF